jgi:hypothetical protein
MVINYSAEDFAKKSDGQRWCKYTLNRECEIFGKTLKNDFVKFSIHKNHFLNDFISKINDYFDWLAGKHRAEELIEYFNKNIESGEVATIEWYENLEISDSPLIKITETGKFFGRIPFLDFYIELEDKQISGLFIENYE